MKIALVLSKPPGYSETFFRNKIQFLKQSGMEVELYVDQRDDSFNLCLQKALPKLKFFHLVTAYFLTLIKNPIRTIRFFSIEIKCGASLSDAIKKFHLNLHLLNSKGLNWIHFGFATMSVGREHIGKILNAKMAVSLRGYDISRYPLKHPGVYNTLWKQIDKVHVISNALAAKAIKLGLPESKSIIKITPAVDVFSFKNSAINHAFKNPLRLTTVARLHWSKGLEYTIEALSLLHANGIEFNYTIVGDGPELERLILAAHQFGIRDKIIFVGKVEHIAIKKFLTETDIYIQYSVQEGFCNATLEAQAMGLLCIVSDAEGLPENIIDEVTGWVVPRRSPKLLSDKIIDISKLEKSILNDISKNAVNRVSEQFNLQVQSREFAKFYSH